MQIHHFAFLWHGSRHSPAIALYQVAKKPSQLFNEPRCSGFNRRITHRTIKDSLIRVAMNIRMRGRIENYTRRSTRKLIEKTRASRTSVRRTIRENHTLRPLEIRKVHELTDANRKNSSTKSRLLLERTTRGELQNLVLSDEQISSVKQVLNYTQR